MARRIKGKSAKRKGSRAEIKVRNLIRTIYPADKRQAVFRVPLSGAGAMKSDVMDGNDPDSCYEVKCQEILAIPQWWRQAVSQAGTARTPILVITQAYRPFYFLMREDDWMATMSESIYPFLAMDVREFGNCANIFDRMAELKHYNYGCVRIDDENILIISQELYLKIKKDIYEKH